MDGFWAFELERRGAAEVLATDLPGSRGAATFPVARELLGSRVEYGAMDVLELDPAAHGKFDVVFMGYVLQMVPDPLRALESVQRVCRGDLLLLETVSGPLELLPAPLARLDARRDGREFFVFNRRGLRKALALTGWRVEATTRLLRDHAGPKIEEHGLALQPRLLYAFGLRGLSAAVRAGAPSPAEA
jgi:SAM-dependent methyltransferase